MTLLAHGLLEMLQTLRLVQNQTTLRLCDSLHVFLLRHIREGRGGISGCFEPLQSPVYHSVN